MASNRGSSVRPATQITQQISLSAGGSMGEKSAKAWTRVTCSSLQLLAYPVTVKRDESLSPTQKAPAASRRTSTPQQPSAASSPTAWRWDAWCSAVSSHVSAALCSPLKFSSILRSSAAGHADDGSPARCSLSHCKEECQLWATWHGLTAAQEPICASCRVHRSDTGSFPSPAAHSS